MPAIYGPNIDKIEWLKEHRPKSHPIPVKINRTQILNMDTGEVLAQIMPGYEFYWNHQHPHIYSIETPPLTKKERMRIKRDANG